MKKLKPLSPLLVAWLALASPALAEVQGNNSVSVTAVSTTVSFTRTVACVCVMNNPTSANELYARIFTNVDTVAAATTSSPIRLEPGESLCVDHSTRNDRGGGWRAVTIISSAGETATARVIAE